MPDEARNYEDYHIEIRKAKESLDSAYTQFVDGAITLVELQQWVINLSFCVNNYAIYNMLQEYNKD